MGRRYGPSRIGMLPIRKVAPDEVALTSYYAKVFVTRSEKVVVNYGKWLLNQIVAMDLDLENNTVTDLRHMNTFVSDVKLPRIYTILSQRVRAFTVSGPVKGDYRIFVDYNKRKDQFGKELVETYEKDGFVFVGVQINVRGRIPILIDDNSIFYRVDGTTLNVLGRIEDLLGIDASKAPVEIAEFSLFSKSIPVAIALGYRYGLTRLMRLLGVTPRRIPNGSRQPIDDYEYAIQFADETLVFSKENQKAQLILAGFNRYYRSIRRYSVDAFDDPEVYVNVMEDNGMRIGFVRELSLAMDMFVDPITEELLKSMNEPTSLDGLLIRACELLLIDWHPDETDMSAMRIRGYERMAGAVYSEMVKGIRRYRSRGIGKAAKIEINPEAVWQSVSQDPSISQVEESNPIQNLKEQEIVTYMGTGGRSARSMVKRTRAFHDTDMGVISEATVDSGAVGVNAYLTANPQFETLRGVSKPYDPKTMGNSAVVSTSALLAPSASNDDPKRVNFISIQHSHGVASIGNKPTPLRTGYERVLAHRVGDLFAYTASGPGEVVKLDPNSGVTIRYKDGTEVSVELGKRYGNVTGTTVPHEIACDLELGDKVKEGDVVSYNTGFFQRDPLDKSQVLWKAGMLVKTAIAEQSYTFEDSSVVSDRVAKELSTRLTTIRTLVVKFDQTVRNLVKPGTGVDLETILCTIEDPVTAKNDLFDEKTLDSLRLLSSNTPKAKCSGVVEKVEVLYHGDMEDMSESVRKIVVAADKERIQRLKTLNRTPTTGQVDGHVRIDKDPLELDSVAIRVFITGTIEAGIGDKGVFGNQMKTIFSNVMTGINRTESGEDIDAVFSYSSINNRIVLSPEIIGTTNTLLKVMSKKVAEKYFSKK